MYDGWIKLKAKRLLKSDGSKRQTNLTKTQHSESSELLELRSQNDHPPHESITNDHNISMQHIAILLGATSCTRLATLLRRVATC